MYEQTFIKGSEKEVNSQDLKNLKSMRNYKNFIMQLLILFIHRLKCPICWNTDQGRILPCRHGLCEYCLSRLIHQ